MGDYKRECNKERKNSLILRNAEGLFHRQLEDEKHAEIPKCEHENYELKWAGERDVDDYKRECNKERKNSLILRNAEGLFHRQLEDEKHAEILKCEHENYELKWAGERDVDDYKRE